MTPALDRWIFGSFAASTRDLAAYRILFASWLLLAWVPRATWVRGAPDAFFSAPLGPGALLRGFPPAWVVDLQNGILVAALVLLLFGHRTRLASLVVAVSLLALDTWNASTGKIIHTAFPAVVAGVLAFSSWGEAWSLDARRDQRTRVSNDTWLLALLALLVGEMMFFSGWVKATTGWLDPSRHALQGHLIRRVVDLEVQKGWEVAALSLRSPLLWKAADYATVALELGFLPAAFSARWFRVFVAGACFFHLGVALLFGIHFPHSLLTYAAFVRWSALPAPRGLGRAVEEFVTRVRPLPLLCAAAVLGAAAPFLDREPAAILGFAHELRWSMLALAVTGAAWHLARIGAGALRVGPAQRPW